MTITVACISDIHGSYLSKEQMPVADLLVIAGDATKRGCHREFVEFAKQLKNWSGNYENIVYVPGKHDVAIYNHQERYTNLLMSEVCNLDVLIDTDVNISGYNIWGTPQSPHDNVWAFTSKNNRRKHIINKIPKNTDIIVSYSPPWSIMDLEPNGSGYFYHIGCKYLLQASAAIKPKLHVFGSSHTNNGIKTTNNGSTTFVNASLISEYDKPLNDVIVVDLI